MERIYLTKQQIEQILYEYDFNFLKVIEISQKVNLTPHLVTRVLREHNRETGRERLNQIRKHKMELALEDYKTTLSITKTANKFHLNRGYFSEYLKLQGVEVINYQNLPRCDIDKFETIDNEEKAYWLGFLYADGSIVKEDKQLQLQLKLGDYNHIVKFKQFMQCTNKIFIKKSTNSCGILMGNQKLANDLIDKGCVIHKSLKLKFPTEEQVPRYLIRHFLRGYIDGDGYVGINHYKSKLGARLSVLGTENFLKEMLSVLEVENYKLSKKGNIFSYEFKVRKAEEILDFIYKDCSIYLERKYNKYLLLKEYF